VVTCGTAAGGSGAPDADGVRRLGGNPVVTEFASGGATIEVTARAGCRALVTRPMAVDVT
jgi:hypothetical protein